MFKKIMKLQITLTKDTRVISEKSFVFLFIFLLIIPSPCFHPLSAVPHSLLRLFYSEKGRPPMGIHKTPHQAVVRLSTCPCIEAWQGRPE